jgi:RNA polymerase sigma factor (sigma-70 family)
MIMLSPDGQWPQTDKVPKPTRPAQPGPAPAVELIPTRWSLLNRLKDWQDQDSWRVFFDTYWRLIYCVARRAGLSDDASQDVVQETLLTVARRLPDFKTDPQAGSFKGWLLQITRRRIIDQWRKLNRQDKVLEPLDDNDRRTNLFERLPDNSMNHLETLWEEEWESNLLEVAVERIKLRVSPKQYQIFDLYMMKQWSVRDVCRTLNVNAGQVYIAKHRVAALLKKELRAVQAQLSASPGKKA